MSIVTAVVTKPIRVLAFMTADLTGRAEGGPCDSASAAAAGDADSSSRPRRPLSAAPTVRTPTSRSCRPGGASAHARRNPFTSGSCRMDLLQATHWPGQGAGPTVHADPWIRLTGKPFRNIADGEPVRAYTAAAEFVPFQWGSRRRAAAGPHRIRRDRGLRVGISHHVDIHP